MKKKVSTKKINKQYKKEKFLGESLEDIWGKINEEKRKRVERKISRQIKREKNKEGDAK
jgi:hypothetical protein